MHPEAFNFIAGCRERMFSVLEIGSYNVNGTVRDLFPGTDYLGIDKVAGPGVDYVADGATFATPKRFDLILCCEAFEHTANWRDVVRNSATLLRDRGHFAGTAAGPGRMPHSCLAGPLGEKEYYANVDPEELKAVLSQYFVEVEVRFVRNDVQWFCSVPKKAEVTA